jgi:hydrogenase maturation protein HypF
MGALVEVSAKGIADAGRGPARGPQALRLRVRGVVQGVGFRPFVFLLARRNELTGWVLNHEAGVEVHVEGAAAGLAAFLRALETEAPEAAQVESVHVEPAGVHGWPEFTIRPSERLAAPVARISPDLAVCAACLRELLDPADRRYLYPYLNCTHCGPRYSIVLALPYDRDRTVMRQWRLDAACAREYHDPADRRFHAQPVACPACGPHYVLEQPGEPPQEREQDAAAIRHAARRLARGELLAVKGLGGYHLACDARNTEAVERLRERKFRKERPFAVMARDLEVARGLAALGEEAERLLCSTARPIVLARARARWDAVAPNSTELGLMLPYTPVHHLLFAAGAPEVLVMTSANRSSEPIAFEDDDARSTLDGIADAFLVGERPIARRVDDSVVRAGVCGPVILRRSRGYAPGVVASLPFSREPLLALGGDLKNSIALVVGREVVVSQHIGDLEHDAARRAFRTTIADLLDMYEVDAGALMVVHDAHPEYASTVEAMKMAPPERRIAVQHHRAHVASVLAERGEWERRVLGVAFDGTGFGDDGSIWGGEIFAGSVATGFERVASLRAAVLAGGDAAARFPVQAAAGFLAQLEGVTEAAMGAAPFHFPSRFGETMRLVRTGLRTFPTTSMGRLFDTVAALAGFTRPMSYEGQAAMWLEQLARQAEGDATTVDCPLPFCEQRGELDFRPLLEAVMRHLRNGVPPAAVALAFHRGVAGGLVDAIRMLAPRHRCDGVALSGGVFQNQLLVEEILDGFTVLRGCGELLINHAVPANDGGICLGQIALAAFSGSGEGTAHA